MDSEIITFPQSSLVDDDRVTEDKTDSPLPMQFINILSEIQDAARQSCTDVIEGRVTESQNNRSKLQSRLNSIAQQILLADSNIKTSCFATLDYVTDDYTRQRVWMALLQTAGDMESQEQFLDELTGLLGTQDLGTPGWQHLIQTWGLEPLLTLATTLRKTSCFNTVESGPWAALRLQIGRALIHWGRQQQATLMPGIRDALLPNSTHIELVKKALDYLKPDHLLAIDSPESFKTYLFEILEMLESLQGTTNLPTEEDCEQFELSRECFLAGAILIYPEISGSTDISKTIDPEIAPSLIQLLAEISTAKTISDLLENISNSSEATTITAFTALYLASSCHHDLKENLEDELGLTNLEAGFLFRGILSASYKAMGQDTLGLCDELAQGQLTALVDDIYGCFKLLPRVKTDRFAHRLSNLIRKHLCDQVIEQSANKPIPLELGWSDKETGHSIWAIAHQQRIQLINTGAGIGKHPASPAPSGIGKVFRIAYTSQQLPTNMLRSYLFGTTTLSCSNNLRTLAKERNIECTGTNLRNLAINIHYAPLKLAEEASKTVPFAHAQRSEDCTVKSLKQLVRMLHPTEVQNDLFHIAGKMMVYATWVNLEASEFEAIFKYEMQNSLAKALFRAMDAAGSSLEILTKVAQHLAENPVWEWPFAPILGRIYQRTLDERDTNQAGEWLEYLFRQNPDLALQCVVDTLEVSMNNQRPIEVAVEALERLFNHILQNPQAKEWAYSQLVERKPEIANFNWDALVNFNKPLATRLADELDSHPKSQKIAKCIQSALTRHSEDVVATCMPDNPKKRALPDFAVKPPKKKLCESNTSPC